LDALSICQANHRPIIPAHLHNSNCWKVWQLRTLRGAPAGLKQQETSGTSKNIIRRPVADEIFQRLLREFVPRQAATAAKIVLVATRQLLLFLVTTQRARLILAPQSLQLAPDSRQSKPFPPETGSVHLHNSIHPQLHFFLEKKIKLIELNAQINF
jgi:hypothetical protein